MRRIIGLTAVVAAAALVVVATAVASPAQKRELYGKELKSGAIQLKCFPDTPGTPTNGWTFLEEFPTEDACMAAINTPIPPGEGVFSAAACDGSVVISFISQEDADTLAAAVQCTAGDAPPPPAGIFLCYSTDQVTPSVWPAPQAAQLLAGGGYWMPYAIKGHADGGTNVGAYHLVCNVAAGQAVGDQFADEGGVSSAGKDHSAIAGALGWYPVISG